MKRVALLLLLAMGCTSIVAVQMPYCPVSDSAWKRADSVPVLCVLDTVARHRHP